MVPHPSIQKILGAGSRDVEGREEKKKKKKKHGFRSVLFFDSFSFLATATIPEEILPGCSRLSHYEQHAFIVLHILELCSLGMISFTLNMVKFRHAFPATTVDLFCCHREIDIPSLLFPLLLLLLIEKGPVSQYQGLSSQSSFYTRQSKEKKRPCQMRIFLKKGLLHSFDKIPIWQPHSLFLLCRVNPLSLLMQAKEGGGREEEVTDERLDPERKRNYSSSSLRVRRTLKGKKKEGEINVLSCSFPNMLSPGRGRFLFCFRIGNIAPGHEGREREREAYKLLPPPLKKRIWVSRVPHPILFYGSDGGGGGR